MVNFLGPGAFGAANPSAVRPPVVPANGAGDLDDWAKDCSDPLSQDGTEWRAALFNFLIALHRSAVRKSGITPSNLDDDILSKAIRSQYLNYAVAGGTANALTVTLDPPPASYTELIGVPLRLKLAQANTGPVTLTPNALAAAAILLDGGEALTGGELVAGAIVTVIFDGTNFQADISSRRIFEDYVAGTRNYVATKTGWHTIELWGGGGGSGGVGSTSANGAGGGGGGGLSIKRIFLTKGTSYSYTIGAGGVGGGPGGNGGTGGITSWAAVFYAQGGAGGGANGANNGGVGGVGVSGDLNLGGGYGSAGALGNGPGGMGGSGGPGGGGGGGGAPGVAANGQVPGGGAGGPGSTTVQAGSNGGAGGIRITVE